MFMLEMEPWLGGSFPRTPVDSIHFEKAGDEPLMGLHPRANLMISDHEA